MSAFRPFPLLTLIFLHAIVLLGGFLGPYDPAEQNRTSALLPPTPIHFFEAHGRFHMRPFVAGTHGSYSVRFFMSGSPYRALGLFTLHTHLFGVEEPGRIFLLGTDEYGRDQLSRMLRGGQISLLSGWLAAGLSLAIGLVIGSFAGFFGGWSDTLLMRAAELFLALPWLYLLLAVRAILPLSLSPAVTALVLVAVIGTVGWARPARLIRGIILSAKERAYVLAARGFGASWWHLLANHCLPETRSVIATQATVLIPQYILAEVALSFVGLGVAEPEASWGSLLAPLRQMSILATCWWMALPAALVMITAWCFSRLEDSLWMPPEQAEKIEETLE
jgi:peptide/nickel transport system permease protein